MNIEEYLEIKEELYTNIFSNIDNETVNNAILRFHYIKFNPNNEPKFDKLIDTIINHITLYCYSISKRTENDYEAYKNRLYREAARLFRENDKSGEFGELILWFLLESVLKAPQVVAKMDLKTNRNDEIKGADGIHINITNQNILEIIFGESKLYNNLSKAIIDAFNSIENFLEKEQYKREYNLITTHFKWLNTEHQTKLLNFISNNIEADEVKIKFAILIGFDWEKYQKLQEPLERKKFVEEFESIYQEKAKKIINTIEQKLSKFKYNNYEFDIFFLPFKSVDEMRKRFKSEL
ncbi:bll2187; hypothetical protein [hydrothermal vent metagenome]|uniref:Anti-bacteriophage protein A/HamA C-terminal domain-containing protein n=1 Tax=hydrothermal vent metagenome TaxID=652676 RepID=A0A1W1BGR7_9ZZZZ